MFFFMRKKPPILALRCNTEESEVHLKKIKKKLAKTEKFKNFSLLLYFLALLAPKRTLLIKIYWVSKKNSK